MRSAKTFSFLYVVGILATVILITVSIQTGDPAPYIAALWLGGLIFASGVLGLARIYRRVMTRLGVSNERLSELKFLQERRYEQVRVRLDRILSEVHLEKSKPSSHKPAPIVHMDSGFISELEDLNSRLQRSERRTLGKISDEFTEIDQRLQLLEQKLSNLEDKPNRK